MLIDGAHHSRELVTISMVSTIMLKFLHAYVHIEMDKKNQHLRMLKCTLILQLNTH